MRPRSSRKPPGGANRWAKFPKGGAQEGLDKRLPLPGTKPRRLGRPAEQAPSCRATTPLPWSVGAASGSPPANGLARDWNST
jgi:hypothetical protein